MRFYFSNRDGKGPPKCAHFQLFPFQGTPLQGAEQVLTLPPPTFAKVIRRTFLPTFDIWKRNVNTALTQIQQKTLQKVVLARACILELSSPVDPFAIAAALPHQGTSVFCAAANDFAFLGASPEYLYRKQQRSIFSEAIAGTCKRGKTDSEDQLLGQALLQSKKDQRENQFVQDYITQILTPFCPLPPTFSSLSLHKTASVQHLYSSLKSPLLPQATDHLLIHALHPTPALCGTPKSQALQTIQELEPFSRRFFGGVVGWSHQDDSEWVVAIRSCLIENNRAILFSGAGIVEGSDPEKEWEELNLKLRPYERIFVDG